MTMRVGQTVCGRFELLREEVPATGSPIFGNTWVVLDGETGDVQRATFVDTELLPSEDAREAFLTHAGALTEVADAGGANDLAPVTYVGREGDHCVVIYEALRGGLGLVDAFVDPNHDPDDRRLELARFIERAPRALGFLHRHRLVHGLVSTATTFSWDGGHALWQYGLVPHLDKDCFFARHGGHCDGAVAPEVAAGGPWTSGADVYAWGAALARWISGKPWAQAVERGRAQKLAGISSPELLSLIADCLAEDPAARPADGEALEARLLKLGLIEQEKSRPNEALVDAVSGVGDHVFEPQLKEGKAAASPSASSSALELPVTNLEDLAEPSQPHAAASHAALVLQAVQATPEDDDDTKVAQASKSGGRQIVVLDKRVYPAEVRTEEPEPAEPVSKPVVEPDIQTAAVAEPDSEQSLAQSVASAVEQGTAALELRDNVDAALASGLTEAEPAAEASLPSPPEQFGTGLPRQRADTDAPMAVRRHRSRATYPLGHTAIPDEPAQVLSREVDESLESEVGDDTNPELTPAEPPVEKSSERYVNLIVAVVGGLMLAYLLMTWLRN